MSARKRSKATRGKENETDNPILGAIARSSMARSLNDKSPRGFAINFGCDTFSPQMLGWVRHRFDAETRDKIGTIVLCALANGDDRIVEMVRDALQKSERMFHRSHEPTLLRRVGVMMSEGCGIEFDAEGRELINVERLKRAVEKRFYDGEKLDRHRWNRVRVAMNWPKLPTGAAAASYKRKSKRRRRRRV